MYYIRERERERGEGYMTYYNLEVYNAHNHHRKKTSQPKFKNEIHLSQRENWVEKEKDHNTMSSQQ